MKKAGCADTVKVTVNRVKKDLHDHIRGAVYCGAFIGVMLLFFGEVCPMRIMLGLPCPGCGLTRSLMLLLQGDFAGSFAMNPMLLPLIAGALLFLYERYFATDGRKHYFKIYLVICVAAFAGIYIVRMKRLFPYSAPMVYDPDNTVMNLMRFMNRVGMYGN